MSRRMTRQFRRAVTGYLLVVLQVHLLGVAMLHWHGERAAPCHGQWFCGCKVPPTPVADSNLLCTACQIVQHSAVQPASAARVLLSLTSALLPLRLATHSYHSELPAMNHGRAPPLA